MRKHCFAILLGFITIGAPAGVGLAADLDKTCLQSFDVLDKSFSTGTSTISCRLLETRRAELFKAVDALPTSPNLTAAADRLRALERVLEEQEKKKDWGSWAVNIGGNALATIGLAGCVETAGAGCALAVLGKALSVISIIQGADDDATKTTRSRQYRAEITAIEKLVRQSTTPGTKVRERLVEEFNELCSTVRKECVKKTK